MKGSDLKCVVWSNSRFKSIMKAAPLEKNKIKSLLREGLKALRMNNPIIPMYAIDHNVQLKCMEKSPNTINIHNGPPM